MTATLKAYLALFLLLLLMTAATLGYMAGKSREHDRRVAEVATLHQTYSDAAAEAAQGTISRLQSAKLTGDDLTQRLQVTEATLQVNQTRFEHEIKRATTGRTCLSADAVRLLNTGTESDRGAGRVPSATGSAAAADGAAATDTDVAEWAALARRQFDVCRARLDALIDFSLTDFKNTAKPRDKQ